MRKAVETALRKYSLVAFAIDNPQFTVRLRCWSKDRKSDAGCQGKSNSIETAL